MNTEKNKDILKIEHYELSSSTEVNKVVSAISEIVTNNTLIHILSFIENTVLVQNLKSELKKIVPNAEIVFLKYQDKSQTLITVYTLSNNRENENLSQIVLKELEVGILRKLKNNFAIKLLWFKIIFRINSSIFC